MTVVEVTVKTLMVLMLLVSVQTAKRRRRTGRPSSDDSFHTHSSDALFTVNTSRLPKITEVIRVHLLAQVAPFHLAVRIDMPQLRVSAGFDDSDSCCHVFQRTSSIHELRLDASDGLVPLSTDDSLACSLTH